MTLKTLAFLLMLPLAAGFAFAQQPPPNNEPPTPGENPRPPMDQPPPAQAPPAQTEPETTGEREINAEVVSSDTTAKTIQVKVMVKKDADAEPEVKEAAIAVDAEAVPRLDSVNPGEKVKLLCRMNGNKVLAVKDIKPGSEASEITQEPKQPPQL